MTDNNPFRQCAYRQTGVGTRHGASAPSEVFFYRKFKIARC